MKKILIVDDELALLRNISKFFGSFPKEFEVYSAPNAEQGYELIKAKAIDVLVTDIRLPGMDGLSLLRLALRHDKDLKIIVMTAYSSPDLRESALRKGALRFMEKPLDLKELLEMVRESLTSEDGWSGTMEGLDIFDFTQIMVLCQKSKALMCRNGDQEGCLVFYKGNMIHASTLELTGKDAFFEIATWTGGKINELSQSSIREFKQNINEPATYLMMEAARLRDEAEREAAANSPAERPKKKKRKATGKDKGTVIKDHLKELVDIEGFQAAAVFTEHGKMLGSFATEKIDIETIGMYANNALLNAQKATNQMGVGRGNMLQIRAPKANIILRCHNEATDFAASKEGRVHVHAAVVLGPEGNAGMALLILDKMISKIADSLR